MKVALAQLNPVVGDVRGNTDKALAALAGCAADKPDLVVFPEQFLVGYPAKDLLVRLSLITEVMAALQEMVAASTAWPETGIIIGAPLPTGSTTGRKLYNSAVIIHNGSVLLTRHKSLLPSYDVFDETRYFDAVAHVAAVPFKGHSLGISVCEDAWNEDGLVPGGRYTRDPIAMLAQKGATLMVNISASPFHAGKDAIRYRLLHDHARRHGTPFVYVNQVGGNDELVFDGMSMCVDRMGRLIAALPAFEECVRVVDMDLQGAEGEYQPVDRVQAVHDALVLGIRDYLHKCGFSRAVIGLSGGIDSAVTCCLAVRALGAANVFGVAMPSEYSSPESEAYARRLAENLGIAFDVIPITGTYAAFRESLAGQVPESDGVDIALQNIQARIRGTILMALSNRHGYLLLSTGNKSETAVGYCTLYGDMNGGLAAISDVPKTMIYDLARLINTPESFIPEEIIRRAPSAELRPDQTDQDSLPPYDILDRILRLYIEEEKSCEEIQALDFELATVAWVVNAVNVNEYKRRQAPPGLKVTSKAFGMGRRMPIAACHRNKPT